MDDPPPPPAKKAQDVVLLGPPTEDGNGVHVLRARDERVEQGELRALREGQPIAGEVVSLKPRTDNPRVCDVESSYAPPAGTVAKTTATLASGGKKKGPAQVATQAYRDNWEEVFTKPKSLLN